METLIQTLVKLAIITLVAYLSHGDEVMESGAEAASNFMGADI
jgi:hypothetical protein